MGPRPPPSRGQALDARTREGEGGRWVPAFAGTAEGKGWEARGSFGFASFGFAGLRLGQAGRAGWAGGEWLWRGMLPTGGGKGMGSRPPPSRGQALDARTREREGWEERGRGGWVWRRRGREGRERATTRVAPTGDRRGRVWRRRGTLPTGGGMGRLDSGLRRNDGPGDYSFDSF